VPVDLLASARERFAGRADVTVSHPRFIEFVAPGVSKGRGVRWLARRHGIKLGAVLAVGDQWNDLEMLLEVGHGAAMPTAPVEVLDAARYIARPLAEEGVASLIESLVLASPAEARAAATRLAPKRTSAGQRAGTGARPAVDRVEPVPA
jgi:hydroxymethylpyrimidine pyrophosphatase-like HAD family hydrolase